MSRPLVAVGGYAPDLGAPAQVCVHALPRPARPAISLADSLSMRQTRSLAVRVPYSARVARPKRESPPTITGRHWSSLDDRRG